ncbi:MAG TPA: GGDEF domain-containing protein [Gemmatimonadales bacterium]
MTDALELGIALAAGVGAGWWLARRRVRLPLAGAAGAHLLPDPALQWLLRAHGGLGVWVAEYDQDEEAPRVERVFDVDRVLPAQVAAIDRRLERAREQEQGGAERLDTGLFVIRAGGGYAVGLLVPDGSASPLAELETDLDRLLAGVRRRPIVAATQARPEALAIESVGSVSLRLAYQLERITDAAVVVASRDLDGVRVSGTSSYADRRLLDRLLPAAAPLARAAAGDRAAEGVHPDATGDTGDRRQATGSAYIARIEAGSETLGAVAIWLPGGAEPRGAQLGEILESLREAGPRLSTAQQHANKSREAATDRLTGLGNRRALEAAMNRPNVSRGVVVVLDIDHFKRLNDSLGHPAGDAALVHVAQLLREQIRSSDTAARIGGEEFALWLPGADLEVGRRTAERLRTKLGTTAWDWQGRPWPLSASFGVAAVPDSSPSVQNLLAHADRALYVAKEAGRNRVESAGRAVPSVRP